MKDYIRTTLIIGMILIVVVLVSWYLAPDWRQQPGGFWEIVAGITLGIVAVIYYTVATFKNLLENQREEKPTLIHKTKTSLDITISSGDRSVAIGGDASNATITTGNRDMKTDVARK